MRNVVAATGRWKIEIVKCSDVHKFVSPPKRWVVERTFAWISRNRRLARDFERYATTRQHPRIQPIRMKILNTLLNRATQQRPTEHNQQGILRRPMRQIITVNAQAGFAAIEYAYLCRIKERFARAVVPCGDRRTWFTRAF